MTATFVQVVIWLVAIVLIALLARKRFPEIWKKISTVTVRTPATATSVLPATAVASPKGQVGVAFLDACTNPFTWAYWGFSFWGVWLYSPKLLATPSWVWVPLGLWTLFILVSQARMSSKMKNGGKEKKAAPGLTTGAMTLKRLAFLSTLGVIAYYAFIAPTGTWSKLTERKAAETPVAHAPKVMVIPEGVPLNPNFTSRKLGGWAVTYVAANPQYQVAQMAWRKQKLTLLKEPGREVTEVVNLTVSGDPYNAALDIHLSGACRAVLDNRTPQISKTCVGWWKDRGGQISGQFYLQVNEGSNRYFDVYLFDGNYLPKKSELAMMLYGPPIPAIMLQFRPKDWSEDKN